MIKKVLETINEIYDLHFYSKYHKYKGVHQIDIIHENPNFTVMVIKHKGKKKGLNKHIVHMFFKYLIHGKTVEAKDMNGFNIVHISIRDLINKSNESKTKKKVT